MLAVLKRLYFIFPPLPFMYEPQNNREEVRAAVCMTNSTNSIPVTYQPENVFHIYVF